MLATVKGDVHDIGKNIVGVVLGCNNYRLVACCDILIVYGCVHVRNCLIPRSEEVCNKYIQS